MGSGVTSIRSKNCGSCAFTAATIAATTPAVSCGASPEAAIRHSRYNVIPETVCTMAVNAASGITYRAISIAFFSASRSIAFSRAALARGVT